MKILVTGAAGFIGSSLCEELVRDEKNEVFGIDCFIGPTPTALKDVNVKKLLHHPRFQFRQENLLSVDLPSLLEDIDVVYHLAAIPGVRSSWGKDFDPYVTNNISVTQRLLEASKNKQLKKFIYASTSSVYGEKQGKVSEDLLPEPLSPYGVTKLTGEHLCSVYRESFRVPTVILRYFTVYGPKQRPDMAFHRFIKQIIHDEPITIFGDGKQTRDFTFIDDCVKGTASVLHQDNIIGEIINIGGKERSSVLEIIELLERVSGKQAKKQFQTKVTGEPMHTWADIRKASSLLNYSPQTSLEEGLKKEYEFFSAFYEGGKR
ncbi:NAD-dependent epimerase/dehydratase family protein [Bacillus timonensis]|nr:NAD-dependent epimerase/dehydratase family protein [Bacillus timonensis]